MCLFRYFLFFVLLTGCQDPPGYDVSTHRLGGAADSLSVFEPNIAIDPTNPDRIVAGAQYGVGYNRGGLRFWTWASEDGGKTWENAEAVPMALSREPTMAADLSLVYSKSGEVLFFGITGDTTRAGFPDAALALARSRNGVGEYHTDRVVGESTEYAPGNFEVSDKPWMVMDHVADSPFAGRLYLSWTRVHVRLDLDPISISRTLVLGALDESGSSKLVDVGDEGLGVQMTVRSGGSLDMVWMREEASDSTYSIMHASSTDGAATATEPTVVVTITEKGWAPDLPTLAVNRRDELLACWLVVELDEGQTRIDCSLYKEGSWSVAAPVLSDENKTVGYPALAAVGNSWWLLSYEADSLATRVVLSKSLGGHSFEPVDTLKMAPLPADGFCPSPMLPCRRDLGLFMPGDYVGFAASGSRLVAAYVLPQEGAPDGLAEMWVSIIDP